MYMYVYMYCTYTCMCISLIQPTQHILLLSYSVHLCVGTVEPLLLVIRQSVICSIIAIII